MKKRKKLFRLNCPSGKQTSVSITMEIRFTTFSVILGVVYIVYMYVWNI